MKTEEEKRAYQKAYDATYKRKKKKRLYYIENREKVNARSTKWYKHHSERVSIMSHYRWIFDTNNVHHKYYKGMPFFTAWNPDKGGSFDVAEKWIIKKLGKRPKGTSLHVVDHAIGFVPGNLEWTYPRKQNFEQMCKIIARQRNHIRKLEIQIKKLKRK